MRFLFLVMYLLMPSVSTFSNGYYVETVKDMMRKELIKAMCENLLKKYNLGYDDPFMHLCIAQPEPFFNAADGAIKGLNDCQHNFECHRWNCTTHEDHGFKLFGIGMARASRESAIMMAMASAGMVEHVTNEYEKGKREKNQLPINACIKVRRPRNAKEYVSISDCNADVATGEYYARQVIEAWKPNGNIGEKEIQMNEHNAAVGRMAVRRNMQQICRCVGLSGACNAKCCYKTLKPLKVSTDWLRERYDTAKKVKAQKRPKRDGTRPLVTVAKSSTPSNEELIYLLESPNYCNYDITTGSLGTKGRPCNECSRNGGVGSCEEMCCGRGYETHVISKSENCNCTFNANIPKVICKTCKRKVTLQRCK